MPSSPGTWPESRPARRSATRSGCSPRASPRSTADPASSRPSPPRSSRPTGTTAGPALTVLVAPRVVVEHLALARIDPGTLDATYLPIDTPITDQERFETFRVRFQLRNADDLPITLAPRLEYRPATGTDFQPLPSPRRGARRPVLRLTGVDADRRRGRNEARAGSRPRSTPAPSIVDDRDGADQAAVVGDHSMGLEPASPALTLPGRSYTEVEFSVRATVDADYLATTSSGSTDGGGPIAAGRDGERDARLSADDRRASGRCARGSRSTEPGRPVRHGWRRLRADPAGRRHGAFRRRSGVAAVATAGERPSVRTRDGREPGQRVDGRRPRRRRSTAPHGPYSLGTSACAACHASHLIGDATS